MKNLAINTLCASFDSIAPARHLNGKNRLENLT